MEPKRKRRVGVRWIRGTEESSDGWCGCCHANQLERPFYIEISVWSTDHSRTVEVLCSECASLLNQRLGEQIRSALEDAGKDLPESWVTLWWRKKEHGEWAKFEPQQMTVRDAATAIAMQLRWKRRIALSRRSPLEALADGQTMYYCHSGELANLFLLRELVERMISRLEWDSDETKPTPSFLDPLSHWESFA